MNPDEKEIRDLCSRYCVYVDSFELDKLMDLFDETCRFGLSASGLPDCNNKDELRQFYAMLNDSLTHQFHLDSNYLIEVHDDTATGTVYYLASGVAKDGTTTDARGYYRDEYVRTPAGWKFRSRESVPLMPQALAAIGGGTTG